jgi:hypothetical protein
MLVSQVLENQFNLDFVTKVKARLGCVAELKNLGKNS